MSRSENELCFVRKSRLATFGGRRYLMIVVVQSKICEKQSLQKNKHVYWISE
jgi:hypothetical protein